MLPPEVEIPVEISEQERLTDYATVSRYPGDWEPITRADAEGAVEMARRVRAAARSGLPKDIMD